MGIIKRMNSKQTSDKSIILTLTNTIRELEIYLNDLKIGKVHNPNKFDVGSTNYCNAANIRDSEIAKIEECLQNLKSTLKQLKTGIIVDACFHYDIYKSIDEI